MSQAAIAPETALRKGEATRQKILLAAQIVFLRQGYLNAEVADIVREAGKSTGTFYIYFNNKAAVLRALVEAFDAQVFSNVGAQPQEWYDNLQPPAWRARLRYLWTTYQKNAPTLYALNQAAEIDAEFAASLRVFRGRAVTDFKQMILGRQRAGFCTDLDPEFGASVLAVLLAGYLHEWLAVNGASLADPDTESRAFNTLVRVFNKMLA